MGDYYLFLIDDEPRSYKEVITLSNIALWDKVITSEIELIMHRHTWEFVFSVKTIGCKWIFIRY